MAKKGCELCNNAARMFCESDQASLCWDCDEKVHAANFLVAKHSRTLLCHVCHSPTPWKAAGPKLGPTVSVCHACAVHGEKENQASASTGRPDGDEIEAAACESESDGGGEEIYTDSEEDEDEEEEDEEEVEEDGENQVVPWSAGSGGLDSPPSSSGSEGNVSLSSSKRSRDCTFESSEDEEGSCSSQYLAEESYCSSLSLFRPSKMLRRTGMMSPERGSPAIVEKLRRFQKEISTENAEAMVLSLSKLTRE